jgi:hypothetical protein
MTVVKKVLWSVFVALSGIFTAFFVEKGLKSIDPLKAKDADTDDAGNDAPSADETETATETGTSAEETPAEETSDKESE